MEIVLMTVALFSVLAGVAVILFSVERIKNARALGKKVYKRNLYYAVIAKLFIKDLPD